MSIPSTKKAAKRSKAGQEEEQGQVDTAVAPVLTKKRQRSDEKDRLKTPQQTQDPVDISTAPDLNDIKVKQTKEEEEEADVATVPNLHDINANYQKTIDATVDSIKQQLAESIEALSQQVTGAQIYFLVAACNENLKEDYTHRLVRAAYDDAAESWIVIWLSCNNLSRPQRDEIRTKFWSTCIPKEVKVSGNMLSWNAD